MKRKIFTTRKYMGDDLYSWAIFRKGNCVPVVTGCAKREASYHADQLEKDELKRQETATQRRP